MRKLILTLWLVLLLPLIGFSQDPNNHWQIGASDVNFSTSTPTVSTVANNGQYGNASISDASGNLLFYTNGKNIWNKNHQVMQNSANLFVFAIEAEQPAVIVPYPGNTNKYFVFFEDSENLVGNQETHFYQYVIVDFTTNPLGQLLAFPATGAYYNYLMIVTPPDEFGPTIEGFYTRQGALTVAKNNSNDGYWLLVNGRYDRNAQHQIYAYSITSTGLNTNPVISNWTSFAADNSIRTVLKIAPNNTTLGLLESFDYLGTSSKFYTLTFNNATGQCSNQATINISASGDFSASTFEFSNDSQKVYLAKATLMVKDLSTPAVYARTITTPALPTAPFTNNLWHVQRDKYDNIVLAGNGLNYLSKINNQNVYSTAVFSSNYANLNNIVPINDSTFQIKYTLPQLIPPLDPCPTTLVVSTNVTSGIDKKQASVSIEATNTINGGASAIYHAPTVVLKPPFNAKTNSTVHIYTVGCTGTYIARQGEPENDEVKELIVMDNNTVKIFPNPNNGIFDLSIKDIPEFQNSNVNINVFDVNGRLVYQNDINTNSNTTSTISLSLTAISNGIYFVKVSSNGHVETLKFIKK